MTTRPWPQPDQTLESLVALNVLYGVRRDNQVILRRAGPGLGSMTPHLLPAVNEVVGVPGTSAQDLLFAHSFANLLRAVLDPGMFTTFVDNILKRRRPVRAGKTWRGAQRLIRIGHFFCVSCIHDDLESVGYAYARRTHLVVGVDVCPIHNEPVRQWLPDALPALGRSGILLDLPNIASSRPCSTGPEDGARRYSALVQDGLRGALPWLQPVWRARLCLRTVCQRHHDGGRLRFSAWQAMRKTLMRSLGPSFLLGIGLRQETCRSFDCGARLVIRDDWSKAAKLALVHFAALFRNGADVCNAIENIFSQDLQSGHVAREVKRCREIAYDVVVGAPIGEAMVVAHDAGSQVSRLG